jgi:RimJ/RimL family protein N-acetyltransferase
VVGALTRRIPTLETERLRIRELTMVDLELIQRILNEAFDTATTLAARERWLQWTVLGYEMFAALEQPHYGERAIILKESDTLIGAVGIVPYIDDFSRVDAFNTARGRATAEVGLFWVVDPAYQGRGYATEAARALIDYLREEMKLGRIIATTGYDNHASQAVMRKLGMTLARVDKSQPSRTIVVGVLDLPPGAGDDTS